MLLFGQQTAGSAPWFHDRIGQAHTIPVDVWPHTLALQGDHQTYLEYLEVSWGYYGGSYRKRNTEQGRQTHLQRLLTMKGDGPVKAVRRPDGRLLVVDGNHRAAIAHHRGRTPEIVEVPPSKWLQQITDNPAERYGSKPGKPYQSVYYGEQEIVVGRRRDTLRRHETIQAEDVLDLGCNIGAATLLAGGHGVDSSPRLVTSAWRLAAYMGGRAPRRDAERSTSC